MSELIGTTLKTFNKKITTSGTAVALSTNKELLINGAVISAPSTNAGPIYIGGTGVTNTAGEANNGYALWPGKDIVLPIRVLADTFINGTENDYVTGMAN